MLLLQRAEAEHHLRRASERELRTWRDKTRRGRRAFCSNWCTSCTLGNAAKCIPTSGCRFAISATNSWRSCMRRLCMSASAASRLCAHGGIRLATHAQFAATRLLGRLARLNVLQMRVLDAQVVELSFHIRLLRRKTSLLLLKVTLCGEAGISTGAGELRAGAPGLPAAAPAMSRRPHAPAQACASGSQPPWCHAWP